MSGMHQTHRLVFQQRCNPICAAGMMHDVHPAIPRCAHLHVPPARSDENERILEATALELLGGMLADADDIPQSVLDVVLSQLLPHRNATAAAGRWARDLELGVGWVGRGCAACRHGCVRQRAGPAQPGAGGDSLPSSPAMSLHAGWPRRC